MRVILPAHFQTHLDQVRALRPDAGDEFLTYGPPGAADLVAGPGWSVFADIVAQAPRNWRPDVFLAWQIEYNTVPRGIEDAECFTVGVVGDWNLGGQTAHLMGGAFDLLAADEPGAVVLRALGLPNVASVPIWSHDPARHRLMPGVERDIDILMIGNLHQDIHRARARWIARAARLSRRYRVVITMNVVGEDYVRMMNRARIVFNHSVRGEVNMRAYEAAACGALLFNEADNPTIRTAFRDGEECVLYSEDNFEQLVDHYLTHEDDRQRIVQAALEVAAGHSPAHVLARILQIAGDSLRSGRTHVRPLRSLPDAEIRLRRAIHGALSVFPTDLPFALAEANAAHARLPQRADIENARGCILAQCGIGQESGPKRNALLQAAHHACEAAVALAPAHASALLNLAHIHLAQGDTREAVLTLGRLLGALHRPDLEPVHLSGPYVRKSFDLFAIEVERIWAHHRALTAEWAAEMRFLLAWRAWEILSDLAYENGNTSESVRFASEALALRPHFAMTRYRLATGLRALGRLEEAEAEYRRALDDGPLSVPVWHELAEVLYQQGKDAECVEFVDDILAILDGCPPLQGARARLEELALRARERQAA